MRRHKILAAFFLAATAFGCSSGDDDPVVPPVDPPVVTGVSATLVSPGDTLIITGSKFSATEAENTITFKNPVSATTPFEATTTELRVVVDKDATSGPITVATDGGSDQTVEVEVTPRGIGEVFIFGGVGANNLLVLPNPTLVTQYLIVSHSANSNSPFTVDHPYTILSASTPPAVTGTTQTEAPRELHLGPHEWFEARRWKNASEDLERFGAPRIFDRKRSRTEEVLGGLRQFYVLKTTSGNQNLASSYQRVTTELRYNGTKCLVYADIDTLASGNFDQTHFNMFGQNFDNSIEATNVNYFGTYSDVDDNNKVIILISPVVNRLQEGPCSRGPCACGFIAGFFNPRDLYGPGQVPGGTSNHAEIIYLLAADPGGFWDCVFEVTETASENLGTITHEHEHLISFSHRIFNQNGASQVTWLEEGMAHMAEDLNGDNSSNITRGRSFRAYPDSVSLENNQAPLIQRGGIYLMLRLLVDRYGTGILKDIVQSNCTGRACIQSVTGMVFYDVFAEFLAAQYLSGKGITDDDRYNYDTIDLNDFGTLDTSTNIAGGVDVRGSVRRSASEFHIFSGIINQDSQFQFNDTNGQASLRSVIVRIQ